MLESGEEHSASDGRAPLVSEFIEALKNGGDHRSLACARRALDQGDVGRVEGDLHGAHLIDRGLGLEHFPADKCRQGLYRGQLSRLHDLSVFFDQQAELGIGRLAGHDATACRHTALDLCHFTCQRYD